MFYCNFLTIISNPNLPDLTYLSIKKFVFFFTMKFTVYRKQAKNGLYLQEHATRLRDFNIDPET